MMENEESRVFLWVFGDLSDSHTKKPRDEKGKKIFELSSMGHVIYYHHS
jgi:hypothetical protein